MFRKASLAIGGVGSASAAYVYWASLPRDPPVEAALQPNVSLPCKLAAVQKITADTSRFRFALPTPKHRLGLPVAAHLLAVDRSMVARA